jgi:hypothetical protein
VAYIPGVRGAVDPKGVWVDTWIGEGDIRTVGFTQQGVRVEGKLVPDKDSAVQPKYIWRLHQCERSRRQEGRRDVSTVAGSMLPDWDPDSQAQWGADRQVPD